MFKTSGQLKESIFNRLRDCFNSDILIIRSQSVIQEMHVIVRDGESIGAPGMKRDDRTMAMALGLRAWEDRLRKPMLSQGKTKQRDEEKRKVTPADKFAIFNRNQLDSMFKKAAMTRSIARQKAAYRAWHR